MVVTHTGDMNWLLCHTVGMQTDGCDTHWGYEFVVMTLSGNMNGGVKLHRRDING